MSALGAFLIQLLAVPLSRHTDTSDRHESGYLFKNITKNISTLEIPHLSGDPTYRDCVSMVISNHV